MMTAVDCRISQAFYSIREKLRLLYSKGFFDIFGASALNKILAFLTNIVIVWLLSKGDYGVFGYANSIYSIALLLTGFGMINGMFQFCLEDRPDEVRGAIYRFTLTRGLLADVAICFLIIGVGLYVPLSIPEANSYLVLFGPLLLLDYIFQYASTVLRIMLQNRSYAILQSSNAVLYCMFACSGAGIGGIFGTIMGRYAAYILSICLAVLLLRRHAFRAEGKTCLSSSMKRSIWMYSISTQLSAALNALTYLLDVFLVGLFLADAASVASYKVATLIPEGMVFIPSSVIVFAAPYVVRHARDRKWLNLKIIRLFLFSGVAYAALSLCLVILAPWIIGVVWGEEYLDAVFAFRLLSVSFFFSAIRLTCTNLLRTLRATRANLVISILSLIANAALCIILIPTFGINGAAFVPSLVSIVAAICAVFVLIRKIQSIKQ